MMTATPGNSQSNTLSVRQHSVASGYYKTLPADELVESCRRGEHTAFDELRNRYARPIFLMAYRLAGNLSDAEDIAQDSLIRIYRSLFMIQNAVTLPAWIHRIVRNVYLDRYRVEHRWLTLSPYTLSDGGGEMLLVVPDRKAPSPQTCAEESERNSVIKRALGSLPDFLRRPVALYYYEERTYQEISLAMDIPIGTVKSRLHRGRLAMRKLLGSDADFECLFVA